MKKVSNSKILDVFQEQVYSLAADIGNELLDNSGEDETKDKRLLQEVFTHLRLQFLQQRSRIHEYENFDQFRVETDRHIRASIDLRGVEEQVNKELNQLRGLR